MIGATCHRADGDFRSAGLALLDGSLARHDRHKWKGVRVTRIPRDLQVGLRRCPVVPASAPPVGPFVLSCKEDATDSGWGQRL